MKCPICSEEVRDVDQAERWGPEFAHATCVMAYNAGKAAELEAMHDMRRELQRQIATLQDRCARSGVEARRSERERLRGYFRDALADRGITWPGEVDILYEKCFGAPYVPDEAA